VLAGNFAIFTNPRDGIARLDDRTPILLMPVRLETRFRDLTRSGGGHELWVRIYPDDCWVDTFDPALTEAEIANTRTYWINWWQAGGIEAQQRAAWRALVGSHGAGRAVWLAERYRPTNVASPPVKAKAEDLVLTIATDTPLGAVESAAAVAFWRSAWLADGATAGVTAARTALDNLLAELEKLKEIEEAEIALAEIAQTVGEPQPAQAESVLTEIQTAEFIEEVADTQPLPEQP